MEKARNPGPCLSNGQGGNSNPGDRIKNGSSYTSIELFVIDKLNTEPYSDICPKTTGTSVDAAASLRCFSFRLASHSKNNIHNKDGYKGGLHNLVS